jgi:hypothetical protein
MKLMLMKNGLPALGVRKRVVFFAQIPFAGEERLIAPCFQH